MIVAESVIRVALLAAELAGGLWEESPSGSTGWLSPVGMELAAVLFGESPSGSTGSLSPIGVACLRCLEPHDRRDTE